MRLGHPSPGGSPSSEIAALCAALLLGGCYGRDILIHAERPATSTGVTMGVCHSPCQVHDFWDVFSENREAKTAQVEFDVVDDAAAPLTFVVHVAWTAADKDLWQNHTFDYAYQGPGAAISIVVAADSSKSEVRYTLPGEPERLASVEKAPE